MQRIFRLLEDYEVSNNHVIDVKVFTAVSIIYIFDHHGSNYSFIQLANSVEDKQELANGSLAPEGTTTC